MTDGAHSEGSDLDRLPGPKAARSRPGRDSEGKQALFSVEERQSAFGAMTLNCSHCGQTTVLSGRRALRSLLPSLHVPRPRTSYRSWMRCPACGRRTWVDLKVRG